MSEAMNNGHREVGFPDVPDSPEAHEAYHAEAIEKIRSGQPTWVQRSFDTDSGRILEFYTDKKPVGYIEEESDGFCDVYVCPTNVEPGEPALLAATDRTFAEAVELLEVQAPSEEAVELSGEQIPPKPSGLKGGYFGWHGH